MDGTELREIARFERLTPFRVRDVLLVSSHFDHYVLEEDGHLADLMNREYSALNLSQSPRLIHSPDAEDALTLLRQRPFDMVITMARIGEMAVHDFAQRAKSIHPGLPVVLLTYNTRELATLNVGSGIDRIFVWTGDSRILLAITKLIEDERNVQHDVDFGNVQIILLVEDSRRFYSAYLPLLYTQLLEQTTRLMGEGANLHERLMRLRARAKILLATDYEEAMLHIERYHNNIIGVFTDGRFPHKGGNNDTAGLDLTRHLRESHSNMPICFQSKNFDLREQAEALGATFIHKEDTQLYNRIADFMREKMSFGDFVFRTPDGAEIARASDLRELRGALKKVDISSIEFHAARNHFSHWMRTRTEFSLAAQLRPKRLGDFDSIEEVRNFLIEVIGQHLYQMRFHSVEDHTPGKQGSGFQRIGTGSLGGKGRGLAFFYTRMPDLGLAESFPDVNITVPRSMVVATDVFESFIERNDLSHFAHEEHSDMDIAAAFLAGKFTDEELLVMRSMLTVAIWPLAVRSSSQLEDASHQPFAGVYSTYMIANDNPDMEVRVRELSRAIRLVYASTYYNGAKAYVNATPNSIEDERMAVVVQELVGTEHNQRFYPAISGVARSQNHYPVEPLKAEDGIAAIALGLGRQVAKGGRCLRFSPAHPNRLHQFYSIDATLRTSQRKFYAVPMGVGGTILTHVDDSNLLHLDLDVAEEDGQLALVGSTYVAGDDRIVDTLQRDGQRIVTFAPALKHGKFPLAEILHHVLRTCEIYLGTPVEIEFAVSHNAEKGVRRFSLLQLRPVVSGHEDIDVDLSDVDQERCLCLSSQALGNGIIDDVADIIYIHPERLNRLKTRDLTPIVERLNAELSRQNRPYLLIGPGRWGTSDPSLGIPVSWSQISGAKTIVEAPMSDIHVDPSQGTHFFQNIVSFSVGYLTLEKSDSMDWDWLDEHEAVFEEGALRHIRTDSPLEILLDSSDGEALIRKPRGKAAD
jgi:hypothetical protein